MTSLLFWLQQFFLPFIELWPVWLVMLIGGGIVALCTSERFFWWWKLAAVVVVVLLLLIRGIILVAFPLQTVSSTVPLQGNEHLPLRLLYRNGDLDLKTSDDENFHYDASELAGTHRFTPGYYEARKYDTEKSMDAVLLDEARTVSLLSNWWSVGTVQFPAAFSQPLIVTYQNATGDVTFANSKVTNLRVEVIESEVTVTIPNEKKEITMFLGGSDSRVFLNVPKSAEIRAKESFKSFNAAPSEFVKTGQFTWLRKGDGTGPTVNLEIALGKETLVIKYIE